MSSRGTSNGNCSGNSKARRARKVWLVETYRADVDIIVYCGSGDWPDIEVGAGQPSHVDGSTNYQRMLACRCYRCGRPLTVGSVTVDRIIPGDKGGTYRRENIRPACGSCNSITGNEYRWAKERAKQELRAKSAERARVRRAAKAVAS